MRQTLHIIAALLFAGCGSAPPATLIDDHSGESAEIQRRLAQIIDAAEKKDFPRLESYHLYGPNFTKYTSEAPGRLDAEGARKGERDGLSAATELAMKADDLKIDVFGDVGIATFVLHYTFKAAVGTIDKKALSTLVFVKDKGEWKITHEHLSGVKSN